MLAQASKQMIKKLSGYYY